MKGIEKQVLNIIKKMEEVEIESIAFKLGIPAKYAAEICSILVEDGYLKEKPNGKFKLSLKGEEVTSPVVETRKPFIRW